MSVIGPRPALWNQYDLIEERDKYGANNEFHNPLPKDKKDSSIEKSYMGIVKKEKSEYSKGSYQIRNKTQV